MSIDWSQAPEGATHKHINSSRTGFWYKFDFQNDTAAYCPEDEKIWTRSGRASSYNDGSMGDMVARPCEIELRLQRTKIIDGMVRDLDVPRAIAVRAYTAGYRKQVQP